MREYHVVAASDVPASASHPSIHELTENQLATIAPPVGVHFPVLAGDAGDHPPTPNPPDPLGRRSFVNRSSDVLSTVSVQSRASDRYSIITNSRDSIRERPTRPSTPTTRLHTPTQPPRLEIITVLPPTHDDGEVNPVSQLLASSSYTHETLSPPPMSEIRRRHSSTSVVVDVSYPSTESLPIPISPAVDHEPLPDPPTSSDFTTLDYFLPAGRVVQLINSDQIPRYDRNVTMQVSNIILSLHTHASCRPRVEIAYDVKPLTTRFP